MRIFYLIILTSLICFACTSQNTTTPKDVPQPTAKDVSQEEIRKLLEQWQSHHIKYYSYILKIQCNECDLDGKYKVRIVNDLLEIGEQLEANGVALDEPKYVTDRARCFLSSFDRIYDCLLSSKFEGAKVQIKASEKYGFPEFISIENYKKPMTIKISDIIDDKGVEIKP